MDKNDETPPASTDANEPAPLVVDDQTDTPDMSEFSLAPDTTTSPAADVSQAPVPAAKKSKKPLVIGLVAVAVLIVGALTYFAMSMLAPAKEDDTAKTESTQSTNTSATDKAVDDVTSVYSTAADDEATTLNTDDSNQAAQTSDSAGTVGDGIDETKF